MHPSFAGSVAKAKPQVRGLKVLLFCRLCLCDKVAKAKPQVRGLKGRVSSKCHCYLVTVAKAKPQVRGLKARRT